MKKLYSEKMIRNMIDNSNFKEINNYIQYLESLRRNKTYGLVWEEEEEDFDTQLAESVPVIENISENDIIIDNKKQTNILIEGDNLHSLKILEQTHSEMIDVIYIDPPYNTGSKDWKYNNSYVDKENKFRHSKWLSMMNKRLRISKKLLKESGTLVCAIDENELASLWLLLEEIFGNSYSIDCITIVHNPRGVQGNNFSYTHEYALFVYKKGLTVIGDKEVESNDISWSNFRNWGHESERKDAKNCFYPVHVKDGNIVGFGEVIYDININPKQTEYDKNLDLYKVYPIDVKGVERKWRYERGTVEGIAHLLRVKQKNEYFEIEIGKDFESYKTVWVDKKFDANEYGTRLLNSMVKDNDFSYPKSVYNVKECIGALTRNNKNAIVLDFFAGSGTTAHAVQLINKEDDGNRKFILCTNNAIGEKKEKEYRDKYGRINDDSASWKKWEKKYGIASSITLPRIKSLYYGYSHSSDIKTNIYSKRIGLSQLKNEKFYQELVSIKDQNKDYYDDVKIEIEDGVASVVGIESKKQEIKGIPANLKYYKCGLVSKMISPRKTVKALSDYIDSFIMIKEDAYQINVRDNFKEVFSEVNKKQVFIYRDRYVSTAVLQVILKSIKYDNVTLYVNESLINDDYLISLSNIVVKGIPKNILKGDFYE